MNVIQKLLTCVSAFSPIPAFINPLHEAQSWNAQNWKPSATFNWSSIDPAPQLQWVRCYERHECARLEVPLDWFNTSTPGKAAIAIIRHPTNRSRSDPDYGGSIILNPGGPGGSGVTFLRWTSYEASQKLQGSKHFDIVSFDPRGVENSTPVPKCFENNLDRQAYWMKQNAAGAVDDSEYAQQYRLAAATAFGEACRNSTIMRYMTTKLVVRDIIGIADALQPDVHEPLVNYWGISYGTYIGNILASVYPGRVGKVVLDGVVNAEEFASSVWYKSLIDAPRALDRFYNLCHEVGAANCSLYEKTPTRIKHKVESLIEQLKTKPMPLTSSTKLYADVLTSVQLRSYLFRNCYFPSQKFPRAAKAIHGLFQSPPNTTLMAEEVDKLQGHESTSPPVFIHATNKSTDNSYPTSQISSINEDAERAIACTDGAPINHWKTEDYQAYLTKIDNVCPLAVDMWSSTTTTCIGWPMEMRAPEHARFAGPFGSKLADYDTKRGARPLLLIGNEADPVTPVKNARAESAKHEGSVVLKTDLYGHATVPSSPIECVWGVVRRYFNDGELPEEGTVCHGDEWEWKEPS